MSNFILTDAWRVSCSPAEKLVLIALADQANDDGLCWPSVRTIELRTCLSDRTVQRALQSLVETGHLTRTERKGRSTYYTVHPRHGVTPATLAPPTLCHPTPDTMSPPPPTLCHPEPSGEPSRNRERGSRTKSGEKKATRLGDFPLTPERRQYAETERVDADREHAKFLDYWHSASGASARKLDWDATWRNWCRRAGEMASRASRPGQPAPALKRRPPTEEELQAARRAALEANRREIERTVGHPTAPQPARQRALSEALSQIGRMPAGVR